MSRQRSMEKISSSEYVSIGELSRLTGCRYSTLKYYTEEGSFLLSRRKRISQGAIGGARLWNG